MCVGRLKIASFVDIYLSSSGDPAIFDRKLCQADGWLTQLTATSAMSCAWNRNQDSDRDQIFTSPNLLCLCVG